MYEIISKRELAPKIKLFEVAAPEIAAKAHPGQFIIVIVHEKGERIPLNLVGYDKTKGTIMFAVSEVGKTTKQLGLMKEGECILAVDGPLGNPSEIKNFGRVLCVAGGVMIAPMLLQVKALREAGNVVDVVIGARRKNLLFFEEELKVLSNKFYVATDDGSKGHTGLGFLKDVLGKDKFDRCVVLGPLAMTREICEITKPFGVPTIVTLMPVMVDGNGMCGVCRVKIGNETKFACVDGPEFDGHCVDFDELIQRQMMFLSEERTSSLLWEKIKGGGCGCGRK
ncbi:MAG TPA: sulfide/dihydroorotate dehydrogenase-like FAD/NAD-binding protein [Candidatus Eisenbacteria bacterium]|jgi:ferredoxin--NADP+ reductase|nr:sulfide/dihydroorotate dehydrogenase-like FAD/NAD-binding protein [Candidatus Eisenbacteria bacterium]